MPCPSAAPLPMPCRCHALLSQVARERARPTNKKSALALRCTYQPTKHRSVGVGRTYLRSYPHCGPAHILPSLCSRRERSFPKNQSSAEAESQTRQRRDDMHMHYCQELVIKAWVHNNNNNNNKRKGAEGATEQKMGGKIIV